MRLADMQTTRLFPKGLGADAYRIAGIAARCDWVVLTDNVAPKALLIRQVEKRAPRHVFLSMRQPYEAIRFFATEVLPQLSGRFVLVSGSGDWTVPGQVDLRRRPFDESERALLVQILGHPGLVMWFAENLDSEDHPKMAPLPLGLVFSDRQPPPDEVIPLAPPLSGRPLLALCAHRVRDHAQWRFRRAVSELARGTWKTFCSVVTEEISETELLNLYRQRAFVLCVEGGGLDPAPKAWQAIMCGAIPIVRKTTLFPAYRQLPVAFVSDWTEGEVTLDRLRRWRDAFAPLHDNPESRGEILRRLGIDYWWAQVDAGRLDDHEVGQT